MTGESSAAVAGCQFEPVVGAPETNLDAIAEMVATLDHDVTLAVFPELCVTGYDVDAAREYAGPVPGSFTDPLVDLAEEHDVTLAVGLPERDGTAVHNTVALVDGEGVTATYRKQNLWGAEREAFAAGDGPVTVDTAAGTVGVLLCYDLNFPEAALAYARAECDVLAVSAAWRESFREDWRLLLRTRALDGTCYVIGVNHAGDQQGRVHAGGSLVAGPDGTVHERVGDGREDVVVPVSPDRLRESRERNPVLESRRQG